MTNSKTLWFSIFIAILTLAIFSKSLYAQNDLPYPVVFVHGLAGSETTFGGTLEYLRDEQDLGDINVFDIVLNGDDNTETANMISDVIWNNFVYNGDSIFLGRRNYDVPFSDYNHNWTGRNLFVLNFKEENIRGASGILNDHFDQSNESAIFKQGFALSKMIDEVLNYTGAEKVILVGHSMGGLAIREYLQRTDGQGVHINWQDPWNSLGHKVARVVTIGTPHLGSNTSPDPTKSNLPAVNGNSEANRDLLWEYDSYNYCEDSLVYKGIYMFGGYEFCIESDSSFFGNRTFDNVDINCDGDINDYIVGINEGFYSFKDNQDMPLPFNIRYTWLTSIWTSWSSNLTGDGAVAIERQWLHENGMPVPAGIADTCMTDVFHTSEGGDYSTILRGLDEPKEFQFAYKLNPSDSVIGFITLGQNYNPVDRDMFLIPSNNQDSIGINLAIDTNIIDSIFVYDKFQNLLINESVNGLMHQTGINLNNYNTDSLFVCLKGYADVNTWKNPYGLKIVSFNSTGKNKKNESLFDIYPNPVVNKLFIKSQHDDIVEAQLINVKGEKVLEFSFKKYYSFNTSQFSEGLYFLKLNTEQNTERHKIIIRK